MEFASILSWTIVLLLLVVMLTRIIAHDYGSHPLHIFFIWMHMFSLYSYLPIYMVFIWNIIRMLLNPYNFETSLLLSLGCCSLIISFHLRWILPDFIKKKQIFSVTDKKPTFRILSSNLLNKNKSTSGIIQEILTFNPDIICLQEFSSRWQTALSNAGVYQSYPYFIEHISEGGFGTAIFSKYQMIDKEIWWVGGELPISRATILILQNRIRIYSIHTFPPRKRWYTVGWRRQNLQIQDEIIKDNNHLPIVAIGDFNASQHNRCIQDFVSRAHLKCAHTECGRGSAVTFPNGFWPVPPIRLDHAFISKELYCKSIIEGRGEGSDHMPLILDLSL